MLDSVGLYFDFLLFRILYFTILFYTALAAVILVIKGTGTKSLNLSRNFGDTCVRLYLNWFSCVSVIRKVPNPDFIEFHIYAIGFTLDVSEWRMVSRPGRYELGPYHFSKSETLGKKYES